MFSVSSDVLALVAILATISGSVWGLAWWLSNKFTSLMALFYGKIDQVGSMILDKLEYHEQHDDTRFAAVNNDLWALRVRNAIVDGKTLEDRQVSDFRDKIKSHKDKE